MKNKLIKCFFNFGNAIAIFYMFIPLYMIYNYKQYRFGNLSFTIELFSSIAYSIFFYKKVMCKKEFLEEKKKNFEDLYKREHPIFENQSYESKYNSLMNFTNSLFDDEII